MVAQSIIHTTVAATALTSLIIHAWVSYPTVSFNFTIWIILLEDFQSFKCFSNVVFSSHYIYLSSHPFGSWLWQCHCWDIAVPCLHHFQSTYQSILKQLYLRSCHLWWFHLDIRSIHSHCTFPSLWIFIIYTKEKVLKATSCSNPQFWLAIWFTDKKHQFII